MKKINIKNEDAYNGNTSRSILQKLWEKNFIKESSKFISPTFLKPEDLGKEFIDKDNVKWKILGQTDDRRDIVCEKIESGEIYLQDRLKISMIVRKEEHKNINKKSTLEYPKKEKKRKNSVKTETLQLNLFDFQEEKKNIKILSARYGTDEKHVDVFQKINKLFLAEENIVVSNRLAGDPAPGSQKKLTVEFEKHGEIFIKSFPENSTVKI